MRSSSLTTALSALLLLILSSVSHADHATTFVVIDAGVDDCNVHATCHLKDFISCQVRNHLANATLVQMNH
jgi:hypothetical protein